MTTLTFNPFDFLILNKGSEKEEIVKKVTIEDFLMFIEERQEKKFELVDGKIIAMANVKPNHGKISSNLNRLLGNYLFSSNSPCFAFQDIKCKIDNYNCPHPDIVVVCNDTVDNPKLLAYPTIVGEIFSSNRKDDEEKLVRYKNCLSIKEILMIEQDKIEITVYTKDDLGVWSDVKYYTGDTILLDSIGCSFDVNDAYHRVVF